MDHLPCNFVAIGDAVMRVNPIFGYAAALIPYAQYRWYVSLFLLGKASLKHWSVPSLWTKLFVQFRNRRILSFRLTLVLVSLRHMLTVFNLCGPSHFFEPYYFDDASLRGGTKPLGTVSLHLAWVRTHCKADYAYDTTVPVKGEKLSSGYLTRKYAELVTQLTTQVIFWYL